MKRYIVQGVVLWGAIGILWYLFIYNKNPYEDREAEFQQRIDSLKLQIELGKTEIDSLSRLNRILDSTILQDKAQLTEVAKKAETFKNKYNEEQNRISDMSDDNIISEFTAAFQ
jgi:chromosome segregation ATPase